MGRVPDFEARGRQAHLRLISMSDLHMSILPHDYVTDRPAPGQGLALAVAEARAAAAEADAALLFDVGDAFEGSPLDVELFDGGLPGAPAGPHPMAASLSAARLDAATLGNHDFDFGLPALARALSGCQAPLVLANIVRRRGASPLDDIPFLPPWTLLTRHLRCGDGVDRAIGLGVIGLAPPQILDWDATRLSGELEARDILETARAWVPRMRAEGADLVIALCHSGIGAAAPGPWAEHAAAPLAGLPEVDAVLAGHAHRLFPHPAFVAAPDLDPAVDLPEGLIHGTPVTMPGFWGGHLGIVDLLLDARPDGGWTSRRARASLRPVRATAPDPGVSEAAADFHRAALAEIRRPVARCARPLHTFFAMLEDCAVVRLVNAAQAATVRAALAGRAEARLPLLSATAPLKAGGLHGPRNFTEVPPGDLALRHLADLYIYPNRLHAIAITGAELRDWLERSAAIFLRVTPGARDAPLLDPDVPAYAFDAVAGVSYRIDLAAPPGARRIVDLRHAGRPVADDDRFVLATNSYRLGGGAGFPRFTDRTLDLGPAMPCRDALAGYFAAQGPEPPLPPVCWGFVPMPGTTVLYPTGPAARAHPPPGGGGAEPVVEGPVGQTADGFDLYRVDLGRADRLSGTGAPA